LSQGKWNLSCTSNSTPDKALIRSSLGLKEFRQCGTGEPNYRLITTERGPPLGASQRLCLIGDATGLPKRSEQTVREARSILHLREQIRGAYCRLRVMIALLIEATRHTFKAQRLGLGRARSERSRADAMSLTSAAKAPGKQLRALSFAVIMLDHQLHPFHSNAFAFAIILPHRITSLKILNDHFRIAA